MKSLRHLIPYLLVYRREIILGGIAALINTAIYALAPWVLKLAVDDLQAGITARQLMQYAGIFVALAVVGGVFRYAMRMWLIGMSRRVEQDLRDEIFGHLQKQPVSFYNRNRTGDLMSRMTNDLDNVRNVLGPGFMYPVETISIAVFSIAMMLWISPMLTLITLLLAPPVSYSVFKLGKVTHKLTMRIQEQYSRLSDQAQENLSGARVVRAFSQEVTESAKFDELNQEYVKRNLAMTRVQALFFPLMGFLFEVGAAIILLVGGIGIIRGTLSLGDFVAFVGYLGMLAWPMIAVGWVANLLQRGAASMERIQTLLTTEPEIVSPSEPKSERKKAGEVVFEHVSVSHDGLREALRDVSFCVKPGETAAIIGRTGCGKSTLVNLLPRLIDPAKGRVLIDGIATTDWDLSKLRERVGMVPQDAFLFSATVRENLTFGAPEASEAEIVSAASISRMDKDVAQFTDGYETMVGERGLTLSGGQKGRLTLARMLVRDPSILILDDALSAVDTHTEEEILRGLRKFMKGRTSILISHRVSTVREADCIYVLDHGRILESGTHDELIALGGYYADLERRQSLEQELELES
jgi:ATP-binding cassette subfamily B protein